MKKVEREIKDTKKSQMELLEMKNMTFEMQNSLDEINSRLHIAEEKIIIHDMPSNICIIKMCDNISIKFGRRK